MQKSKTEVHGLQQKKIKIYIGHPQKHYLSNYFYNLEIFGVEKTH